MGECILHGNGGGGAGTVLNFKVVGGTTEPASPSENMIWINTDTPITWWGIGDYNHSPGWSTPDGYVYINADTSTNTGDDFNALKKNEIWLRPIHAIQRVNGAWVDKTAKIYQNGAWVEWWNGHLYEYGDQHDQITDGWTSSNYKAYGHNTTSQFNTNNIYIWGTNGGPAGGVGTVNKIDLSKYTKLKLLYTGTNTGGYANLSVLTNKSNDIINAPLATATIPNGTSQTVTLNITNINEGYIAVGTSRQVYIYDIWLE